MLNEPPAAGRAYPRVLKALDLFASCDGALTLSEVSEQLRTPRSSTWLLLQHLGAYGYIDISEDKRYYSAAAGLLRLALKVLNRVGMRSLARPHCEWLCEISTMDVYLGVRAGDDLLYVDRLDGTQSVRLNLPLGVPRPLHCTSAGLVALAYAEDYLLERFIENSAFPAYTATTIQSGQELRTAIAEVRKRGYAASAGGMFEGISSFAVPIKHGNEQLAAVLALSGHSSSFSSDTELPIKRLFEAKRRIEGSLSDVDTKKGAQPLI